MIASPGRDNRRQRRVSEQTLSDHVEIVRRIRGRELELARLTARLTSIIPSQKRKETLIRLANKRAVQLGQPFLPRLVARNLSLIILWFADNCPDVFNCVCITEFFPPSLDQTPGDGPLVKEELDAGDNCPFDEPAIDLVQDDEMMSGWFVP
jgi:hypothetical protein